MKKFLIVLFGLLISNLLVAQDLKLEEIIANNLKAIGQEKLATIQTIKLKGKMTQGAMEFSMTQYQKKPDIARQEIEIQGMKIIVVINGKTGWTINPMAGSPDPQDLSPEMISSQEQSSLEDPVINWDNPFYNWKEKGTTIELVGKDMFNGSLAYNLKFTFKDKRTVNYYVDATKFVVVGQKSNRSVQGQSYEEEHRYSEFRDDSGILNPARMEVLINGQTGQVFIMDKCEFNIPINDSIFIKPARKIN